MIPGCFRHLSLILSTCLALTAAGCGDDDGGSDRPDANTSQDDAASPDAAEQALLRSGTIAVTETQISNDLPGPTWSGALVRVGFSDATTGNPPAPVDGFDQVINSCVIQIWDVGTHTSADAVDEGAVQITGTENGTFACGFVNADLGYVCQSTDADIAGGTAGNGNAFVLTGATGSLEMTGFQASANMKGMYISLTGFPNLPDGTRFPIVAVDEGTDTLTLAGVPAELTSTGDADSTFATFVGLAPVPGGAQFLLGADDTLNVTKAAGGVVDMIDEDFQAHGQGFTLLDNPGAHLYLPSTIPVTAPELAGEVNFKCDGAGCGATGSGGLIAAIVINGETTDAPVGDITSPADAMPAPVNQYATFTCAFASSDIATLSVDMMKAILGTHPTRIQTSVGRYRGAILPPGGGDGTWSANVLQGHAYLGWSDAPPPK
jgi:hypothetical protein